MGMGNIDVRIKVEGWKEFAEALETVVDTWEKFLCTIFDACPNKRLVHLAKYSKNPRVRKKARKRILQGKW